MNAIIAGTNLDKGRAVARTTDGEYVSSYLLTYLSCMMKSRVVLKNIHLVTQL